MVILWTIHSFEKRVMGFEPTISCLGSMRSTTELRPLAKENYTRIYLCFPAQQYIRQFKQRFPGRALWVSHAKGLQSQVCHLVGGLLCA